MKKPLYDVSQSAEYNLKYGPFFDDNIPDRIVPPRSVWQKIFEYNVMSTIGLAACPIGANAKGIFLASRLGFDIITHKTVRSHAVDAHPMPNMALIPNSAKNECIDQIDMHDRTTFDMKHLSISNSIGNASFDLSWHAEQIAQGRKMLLPGQVLVVSIYGTETKNRTIQEDFAYIAQSVIEAGAHVVELNFSCPNLRHGMLYKDVALAQKIVKEVVCVAKSIPVTVKTGLFLSETQTRQFMCAISHAGARGIVGINAIPGRVIDAQGNPYFGKSREISGLSGALIFERAQQWIKSVARINTQEKFDLTLFGMGGITLPEQFDTVYMSGAHVALTATGALWNPYLALEYTKLSQPIFAHKVSEIQHER